MTILNLENCKRITNEVFLRMPTMRSLHSLNVAGCTGLDADNSLFLICAKCPSLESLKLCTVWQCEGVSYSPLKISESDARHLSDNLASCLCRLDLNTCHNVTPKTLRCLSKLTSLTSLSFPVSIPVYASL